MVKILYFARLREALGTGAEEIRLDPGAPTVAALMDALRARGGAWGDELAPGRAVRVAVNQRMAAPDTRLSEGDEVAFFPPVTGG